MVNHCYCRVRIFYERHIYLITSLSHYTLYHFQKIWPPAICAIPILIENFNQNLNLQALENQCNSTDTLTWREFCQKNLIWYFTILQKKSKLTETQFTPAGGSVNEHWCTMTTNFGIVPIFSLFWMKWDIKCRGHWVWVLMFFFFFLFLYFRNMP